MRRRWIVLFGLVLVVGGCAGTRPCMVIPGQIELARDVRDAARVARDEKKADLDRWVQNVEQSRTKLARLTEERDLLKAQVSGSPAAVQGTQKKAEEKKK
jgi:hypothetical protein